MDKSNTDILLSFIIPVYNVEEYLSDCLDSILHQLTEECEIVLVDDGSTDLSGEICRQYCDKSRLIRLIQKENGGLSSARNAGISATKGRYVTFVDSDDKIFSQSVQKILEWIKSENADICFLKAVKIYQDGSKTDLSEGIVRSQIYLQNRERAVMHLATRNKYPGSAWAKLFRREFLINNNLFFPFDRRYSEDLGFVRDCILCANCFDMLDFDFYQYRQNRQGSITNKITLKNFNDLLLFVSESAEKLTCNKKVEDPISKSAMSFVAYEYSILLYLYGFVPKKEKKSALSELKKYKWTLNFSQSSKTDIIRMICSIFGIRFTSFFIKQYRKIVER